MCTWPLRASVADHEPVKGVCPAAYCPVCNVNVLSGRDVAVSQEARRETCMETFCNERERTDVKPPGRYTCDLCCGITVGSEKDQSDAFDDMERTENTHR